MDWRCHALPSATERQCQRTQAPNEHARLLAAHRERRHEEAGRVGQRREACCCDSGRTAQRVDLGRAIAADCIRRQRRGVEKHVKRRAAITDGKAWVVRPEEHPTAVGRGQELSITSRVHLLTAKTKTHSGRNPTQTVVKKNVCRPVRVIRHEVVCIAHECYEAPITISLATHLKFASLPAESTSRAPLCPSSDRANTSTCSYLQTPDWKRSCRRPRSVHHMTGLASSSHRSPVPPRSTRSPA